MTSTAVDRPHASYLTDFEQFARQLPAAEPASIGELRRRAIDYFGEVGFPTTKLEDWRFTNVSRVASASFARSRPDAAKAAATDVSDHLFESGTRLVFLDGHFAPELSSLAGLPEGVIVDSLAHAITNSPERVEPHLGQHAKFVDHPFVALNTAFMADGAFIDVPRGVTIEEPIQLLFAATGSLVDGKPVAAYPRNLIVAGEASHVRVIETYVGLAEASYLTCPVTEVVAADGAYVDHYKVQKESVEAYHLATLQLYQGRSSNVFSHSIATGGALVRNDTNANLDAEGSECSMDGLYVLRGNQFLDNHMRLDHAKPHCDSFELFKGILDQSSRAVFNGRIYVAQDAQKTDAKQSSRALLLSKDALVNSNPQLEIFADDVKCTHGSTVGQLDDDAVFYLRSRGIGEEAARSLLTYAFASDIVERIKIEPVRRELEEFLFDRLPKGEVVRQAV
jgi:Fe-S cluster assembly protein SufD